MGKYTFLDFLKTYEKTFIRQSIPDIIELTAPLRKLGLTYFSAARYDSNNVSLYYFVSDDTDLKYYIEHPNLFYEEPMSSVTRLLKPGDY